MGTHRSTPVKPLTPNHAIAKGGNSKYSGIRNRIWRVNSKMVAFSGCPLDWK